ncbi:SDR family oxidoreductase [Allorhodopirellula solitaria]|uniref:3-oxoacyl-[acyl-carrier-protein] reductase FabG n=1 Tax=Allorhodopirellula solitaria TaxID=2527987 RepID=A0A5C5XAT2_9BACT|nr:SDR family oxidoreductase [Allorhodopirellula solitaria]TWT59295.1 3-oxoacyl-[acyl-carrier-protein] reductase FabG [Allorhodopirellula solitaria]
MKTAVVTGGSGGIGGGICRRLAADGFQVVVHYGSDQNAANAVVSDIQRENGAALAIGADVSSEKEVQDLFAQTLSRFGSVDVVVANAGAMRGGPIADCSVDDFDRLMAVNFRGAFLTIREAASHVRDNGRIIFVSSQLAERPRQGTGLYSATKAAIDAMLVSLSKEVGGRGIAVNSVRPGATSPGMFDESDEEKKQQFIDLSAFGRLGTPEDIAAVVSFLAGSDGKWLTGQHIRADGGMSN